MAPRTLATNSKFCKASCVVSRECCRRGAVVQWAPRTCPRPRAATPHITPHHTATPHTTHCHTPPQQAECHALHTTHPRTTHHHTTPHTRDPLNTCTPAGLFIWETGFSVKFSPPAPPRPAPRPPSVGLSSPLGPSTFVETKVVTESQSLPEKGRRLCQKCPRDLMTPPRYLSHHCQCFLHSLSRSQPRSASQPASQPACVLLAASFPVNSRIHKSMSISTRGVVSHKATTASPSPRSLPLVITTTTTTIQPSAASPRHQLLTHTN
ncbi:hypothetical protein O3P69_018012 [Scylla paramamosain]|uniref:Uncharacterized protein n=1 Tax=Scylla paramamosain TaxID=85552 RepID=A0AAW0TH53_SCYPA